ncbi:MAG: hypothetical protein IJI60_00630 [Bacilli bacterium]|nr:hypothetical protein [Bacilli bacterium]
MSRMDRYNEEENSPSRLEKNQELYRNFSNNTIYTNVTDITTSNTYEIHPQDLASQKTREAYQQIQKYQDPDTIPKEKKELEEFNHFYPKKENKVYDINSVLEAARRNREEKDDQEEKRKLKNDYNILSGINKQELEKYREEKRKRMMTPEEEEIRELIDTIASKTLAGEIDKATSINLLSDLMATSVMDKVSGMNEDEESSDEEKEEPEKEEESEEEEVAEEEENTDSLKTEEIEKIKDTTPQEKEDNKDEEFYTRSMDLSDKDLNISDDFKEESLPLVVKILIFLVIFAVITLAIFFIYQKMS